MIDLSSLRGQRIAVMGLGKTGISSALALAHAGVEVCGWDDQEVRREEAQQAEIPVMNLMTLSLANLSAILWSPGIPHTLPRPHPVALRAQAAGIPLVSDIEILCRVFPNTDMVAITGTNGKSTTTALVGHVLSAFRPTQVGGNIGQAVMTLESPGENGTFVLEMSSYQIELTPSLRPVGAVLLNITPDHLDRHGGIDGYIAAKEKMFAHPLLDARKPTAVVCIDTEPCRHIADRLRDSGNWTVIPVSTQKHLEEGVFAAAGILYEVREGAAIPVADLNGIQSLKGRHNHENAACAYAVVRHVYGYEPEHIAEQIKSFGGLPHRQFLVRVINGVAYINDSKATNADAAEKALVCYKNIYWILGGLPKEGGLAGLEPYMDRIAHAFLIGEAAPAFAQWLEKMGVSFTQCGTLDVAVETAHEMAQKTRSYPGGAGTVLLSPACASWDQFLSFEHRGDVFADIVQNLREEGAR